MVLRKCNHKDFFRNYYLGSMSGLNFEKSELGFAYLTLNYHQALYYAVGRNHKIKKNSAIYDVTLKQGANIFNIDDARDAKRLENHFNKQDFEKLKCRPFYIKTDWSYPYLEKDVRDRKKLFAILKDLGYDGIFSDEKFLDYAMISYVPFVCVWNTDKLSIISQVSSNAIKSMPEYIELNKADTLDWNDKVLFSLKNKKGRNEIYKYYRLNLTFKKGYFYKDDCLRFITLTEKEMIDVILNLDIDRYIRDRLSNGPYDRNYDIIKNDGRLFIYGQRKCDKPHWVTYWSTTRQPEG